MLYLYSSQNTFLTMNFFKSIFLSLSLVLSVQIATNASSLLSEANNPERVDYPRITQKEMIVYQGDTITKVVANGLSAIIARPDQDVNKLLAAVNLNKAKFAAYNDFSPILLDDLITGAVYYLEKKNKSGQVPFHIVGPRETIWDISQMYAIRKDVLLKKNRMSPTEDVVPGRKLFLQKKRGKKDKVEIVDLPDNTPDVGPWDRFIDKKDKETVKTIGDKNNTLSDLMPSVNKDAKFHTVRDGETIFSISKVYNVTPLEIKKWNNLENINLKKGDIIQVKPTSGVANNNNVGNNNNNLLPNTNTNNNSQAVLLPALNNTDNTANNNFNQTAGNNFNNNNFNQAAGNSNFNNTANNVDQQVNNISMPANKMHIVERGEGVYSIARKYNLQPKELMKWNGLNNNSLLDVGEQIYLAPGMAPPVQHSVKRGETLYRISQKYDVEVSDIMAWNQLNGPDIQEGQSLFVSAPNFNNQENVSTTGWQQTNTNFNQAATANENNQIVSSTANTIGNFNQVATGTQNNLNTNNAVNNNATNLQSNVAGYHVVQPNENIYEIAAKYKIQVRDLRDWNDMQLGTNIKPGDRLIVDAAMANTAQGNNNAFNQPATENSINNTNNNLLTPAVENNTNNNTTGNSNNFLQPANESNNVNPATGDAVYHTVKPNENLFSISKMYGVQVSQIKRLSQKNNNQVSVGEKLRIR